MATNKTLWIITGIILALPLVIYSCDTRAAMKQCQLTHSYNTCLTTINR